MQKASIEQHDCLAPPPSHILIRYRLQILLLQWQKKISSYIRKFRRGSSCKVIPSSLTASSYMTKYLRTFPHILGSPSSYMTLQPIPSEFPEKNFILFFYQCLANQAHGRRKTQKRTRILSCVVWACLRFSQLTRQPCTALDRLVANPPPPPSPRYHCRMGMWGIWKFHLSRNCTVINNSGYEMISVVVWEKGKSLPNNRVLNLLPPSFRRREGR